MARTPHRIPWLDTLKAIGLFFVVVGHTDGIGEGVRAYIYSFHIPLFFFMAGYLVNPDTLQGDFGRAGGKHLRSLIFPYCGFGVITYLIWLVAGRHYGRDLILAVSPMKPLLGMVYGVGVDHWLRHNVALWFLPALFCLHCLYYWLSRLGDGLALLYAVVLVSLAGCVARPILPFRLPWGIEPACAGVMFYGAGRLLRSLPFDPRQIRGMRGWLIMAACLAIQWAGIEANGRVDMNELMFGNLAAFYLTAFCGIAFWAVVSMTLPPTVFASAVAREAMLIFPLHTLVFSLVTLVITHWLPLGLKQDSALAAGVYTAAVFVILIPGAPWLRQAFFWMKPAAFR